MPDKLGRMLRSGAKHEPRIRWKDSCMEGAVVTLSLARATWNEDLSPNTYELSARLPEYPPWRSSCCMARADVITLLQAIHHVRMLEAGARPGGQSASL